MFNKQSLAKRGGIVAWHFNTGYQSTYTDDGDRVIGEQPFVAGLEQSVEGDIASCQNGLHASISPLDALNYGYGAVAVLVEVWGDVSQQADKIAGRHRRVIAILDASTLLHEFACQQAEHTLTNANVINERIRTCIKVSREWLKGEATTQDLEAAWQAAWQAAREAAWQATREAAREAANVYLETMLLDAMHITPSSHTPR